MRKVYVGGVDAESLMVCLVPYPPSAPRERSRQVDAWWSGIYFPFTRPLSGRHQNGVYARVGKYRR